MHAFADIRRSTLSIVFISLVALAGCATVDRSETVPDPYESENRAVFEANAALFNAASGAGEAPQVPVPVRRTLGNLAQNLDTPKIVVNDILQGDGESAVHNTFRFILNTTLGVGGIFDPATSFGLEPRGNDFGRTLYVWGAGPGNYAVVPVIGPTTDRELIGKIVDMALNPLSFALPETELWYARGIKLGDRGVTALRYGETIGDILSESADPYLAARNAYLQNRRFELTGGNIEDDYVDPYEDLVDF